MFTFHKLTKDQYEKVVKENNIISNAIYMVMDTNDIHIYNKKGQLEISDNIFTLLTNFPELNKTYSSLIQLNKKIADNELKIKQSEAKFNATQNKEKEIDLKDYVFKTKKQQNNNLKELNSQKEDEIIFKKHSLQKEAVKWFKDTSDLFNFNNESFSNNLGIQ